MNKIAVVTFSIAVLVASVAFANYLIVVLPKQYEQDAQRVSAEKIQQLRDNHFRKNQECQKYEKEIEDFDNNLNSSGMGEISPRALYAVFYSPSQNDCLSAEYSTTLKGVNAGKTTYWINNLTTLDSVWSETIDTPQFNSLTDVLKDKVAEFKRD